jgi:hypothetical protein
MVRVKVWVAWTPVESVTIIVNEKVPAVVGVPWIRPSEVSESPGGSDVAADHL